MQDKLGAYCVNLGIPGGNNYFSMVNSAKLINAGIVPKGVFYQCTYSSLFINLLYLQAELNKGSFGFTIGV